MHKKILILPVLLLLTGSLFAQATIEARIAPVINALNTKNSEALISQLDDSCKIANLPRGHNNQVIPMVLRNYGAIASYKIVKQTTEYGNTKVFLDVVYQNGAQGHPWFLLNGSKVLEMHIIKDVSIAKEDDLGKATVGGQLPDVMTVPFYLNNNLIYVNAEVNGIKGLFQIDSGSPVILLDKHYFPDADNTPDMASQLNLTGFNGKLDHVSVKQIDSLKWGEMNLLNFKAASVNMISTDNINTGTKIFGLLGYEVFKDYEITFNYLKHSLTLIKVDGAGNYVPSKAAPQKAKAQIAVVMQRHIPIIPVKINGQIYQMGIDCGANANVIYSKYYDQVRPLLSQPMEQQLTTAGDNSSITKTYLLKKASTGSLAFTNMLTIFSEDNMYMPRPENKLQIDGLLGTPFLNQYIIAINFKKGQVMFYK